LHPQQNIREIILTNNSSGIIIASLLLARVVGEIAKTRGKGKEHECFAFYFDEE
jgi:ABC-type phosphate transport system permease subunit